MVHLPAPHQPPLMAPLAVRQSLPSPLRYSYQTDLTGSRCSNPLSEWRAVSSSHSAHHPLLTGNWGLWVLPLFTFLPSLGELEKQQGTKALSVRSSGAQGDPQSKQGSPTGETGLCPHPTHAEATTPVSEGFRWDHAVSPATSFHGQAPDLCP